MINFDGTQMQFSHMGYFNSEKPWIHPKRISNTYEIIFVTDGQVFMREEDKDYTLNKGDLLILNPNLSHEGFKESANVKFYWLHLVFLNKNFLSKR